MKVISRPRHAGKTTQIVELALRRGLDILVPDIAQKRYLYDTFRDLRPDQVFTLDDVRAGKRLSVHGYNGTLVDNADMVLQNLLSNKIEAISLTKDEKK